jgi:hypothetical protein
LQSTPRVGDGSAFFVGIMEHQTKRVPTAWWHGLMYATSIILIIAAVPATVFFSFLLPLADRSTALIFAARTIPAELIIAVALFFVAQWITKRSKS